MTGPADDHDVPMSSPMERLEALSYDEALWRLDADEHAELLEELGRAEASGSSASERLEEAERCAALIACTLAVDESSGPASEDKTPGAGALPASLLRKLEADAVAHARIHDARVADPEPSGLENAGRGRWLAFTLAAAAAVLAFFAGFLSRNTQPGAPDGGAFTKIAQAQDLLRIDWKRGPSTLSGEARGEILWSDSEQRGYMRFRGLPVNDKRERQYQLWIFDADRDAARPVDGGVFDIPAGRDEVLVPIDAAIRVHKASAFAVTVERPGGVVVSEREHIVATAGL